MTSNTSLNNLEGRVSRPQEDKSMFDTISSRLFREIGVNSLNNVGEASGEVIHKVGGVIEALIPLTFSTK